MKRVVLGSVALWITWIATPVQAHHSGAVFDAKKLMVLHGTVKAFQWTNPHCWLQLLVEDKKGGTEEWSVELGSVTGLYRSGWRAKTVQSGEDVSVTLHPMRNGTRGGSLVSVTLANGTVLTQRGG